MVTMWQNHIQWANIFVGNTWEIYDTIISKLSQYFRRKLMVTMWHDHINAMSVFLSEINRKYVTESYQNNPYIFEGK